jgi:hypothetical protein
MDHLPAEAAEALLELATGGKPRVSQPVAMASPFEHPDAQRRFRVMTNVEELQRALDFPWEKWTVFLHPEQRQWVEHDYNGPARVAGSAGTGKTIVALHLPFLLAEWDQIVDAWQLESWEAYRDVVRLGRKTRLPVNRASCFSTSAGRRGAAASSPGSKIRARTGDGPRHSIRCTSASRTCGPTSSFEEAVDRFAACSES